MNNSNSPTRNDLLNLGVLAMSLSKYPDENMTAVVESMFSPLNSSLISTIGSKLNTTDPLPILGQLRGYLDWQKSQPGANVDCRASLDQQHAAQIAAMAITTILVTLRLISKRVLRTSKYGWEDITLILACILNDGCVARLALETNGPAGTFTCQHVWFITWNQYKILTHKLWEAEVFYSLNNLIGKLAVMLFYWNLIPRGGTGRGSIRYFHKSVLLCTIFLIMIAALNFFTAIFQCKPIQFWEDPLEAKCLPRELIWTPGSVLVEVANVVCLLLPVRVAWDLNLTRKQKIQVTGLFGLGLLACIACLYRVVWTSFMFRSADWTNIQCKVATPTVLEVALTISAICVPSVKLLISAWLGRCWRRTKTGSRGETSSSATMGIAEIVKYDKQPTVETSEERRNF